VAETGAARHTMLVRLPNALMREGDARSASARGERRNAREARARERRAEAEGQSERTGVYGLAAACPRGVRVLQTPHHYVVSSVGPVMCGRCAF
jgi:hypothetical protein